VVHAVQVSDLYKPTLSASSISYVEIEKFQLDDKYYSPCANTFILIANCLAFGTLENIQGTRLMASINANFLDFKMVLKGHELYGYCSQKKIKENGVTALLTANISKNFMELCRNLEMDVEFSDRVSIMHQGSLKTVAGKGNMDISLFYRFQQTDINFVHSGCAALFPFLFIEFHKESIVDKKAQASIYANHLFRLMDFEETLIWVPLLGILMSEHEMEVTVYSPSMVYSESKYSWKIAEVEVMKCSIVSSESFYRLLHIMVGWTKYCSEFLCSPFAQPPIKSSNPFQNLNDRLLLRKHSNVVMLGNKMFKCYDYRYISKERSNIEWSQRRNPEMYKESALTGIDLVVNWVSSINAADSLQIISYDMVSGVHYPSCIGHMIQVLRQMARLHAKRIVHGDLRFSNIVFSMATDAAVSSTIIDFDYSGREGEKAYPEGFNLNIVDGLRHTDVQPKKLLNREHDIAAVQWMWAQYRPKKVELRDMWSSCLDELIDLLNIVGRLEPHDSEELELVGENRVVMRESISPDTRRRNDGM